MGLFTGLLLLPLAPVRGVIWVADKVHDAADRELHDPGVIRAQLAAPGQTYPCMLLSPPRRWLR